MLVSNHIPVGVYYGIQGARDKGLHGGTFRMFFAILTADSAFPFPWLWYGDDLIVVNPYSQAKLENSWLSNCGPLPVMHLSGIPCRPKFLFMALMTVLAVVFLGAPVQRSGCSGRPSRGNCCHPA